MSEYTRRNEADELRDKLSTCHDYIAKLEAECKVLKEKLHEKELAVEHNRKVADEASKMKAEIDFLREHSGLLESTIIKLAIRYMEREGV